MSGNSPTFSVKDKIVNNMIYLMGRKYQFRNDLINRQDVIKSN